MRVVFACLLLCVVAAVGSPSEKLQSLQGPVPIPQAAAKPAASAPAVGHAPSHDDNPIADLMEGIIGAAAEEAASEPQSGEPKLRDMPPMPPHGMPMGAMPFPGGDMVVLEEPHEESPFERLLDSAAGGNDGDDGDDGDMIMFGGPGPHMEIREPTAHGNDLADLLEGSPQGPQPMPDEEMPFFLRGRPNNVDPDFASLDGPAVVNENPLAAILGGMGPGIVVGGGPGPQEGPLEVVEEVGPRPRDGAPIPIQALLDGLVGASSEGGFPLGPMDWTKNGDKLEFRVPLPTNKNLKVHVHNVKNEHFITISEKQTASEPAAKPAKDSDAQESPITGEDIESRIELPYAVKSNDVKAKFHDGVLVISIPFESTQVHGSVLSKVGSKKVTGARAPKATPLTEPQNVKSVEVATKKPAEKPAAPTKTEKKATGDYKPVEVVPSLDEVSSAVVKEAPAVSHKITRTKGGLTISK